LNFGPSFLVEKRNSLAWVLPTKQKRFLEARIVQRDSLHTHTWYEIVPCVKQTRAVKRAVGARTYLEAYFAENMVAVPPHKFCTQISIRKPYGIYKQNFKRKVVGGTAGVFSNWLTFGSIPKGT